MAKIITDQQINALTVKGYAPRNSLAELIQENSIKGHTLMLINIAVNTTLQQVAKQSTLVMHNNAIFSCVEVAIGICDFIDIHDDARTNFILGFTADKCLLHLNTVSDILDWSGADHIEHLTDYLMGFGANNG